MCKHREFPQSIIQRYNNGESACSIAKDFNTNNGVIIRFLQRQGITTRSPNKRKDMDSTVKSKYLNGASMRQIAEDLKITHGTVRRHLLQLKVKSRGKPTGINHHMHNPNIQFKDRCRKYLELMTTWQKDIFVRDNYTCWICGNRGGDLNAHHIIPFDELIKEFIKDHGEDFESFKKSNITNDISIGITLCIKCHYELHYDI